MSVRARTRWRIGLTIAAAIVLVVGAVSCVWGVWIGHDDGMRRQHHVSLVRACVYATYSDRSARAMLMSSRPVRGWNVDYGRASGRPVVELVPHFEHQAAPIPGWALRVPLWLALVPMGLIAGRLWWKHVSRPPHQCAKCGYDLRGVRSEVCPECGERG